MFQFFKFVKRYFVLEMKLLIWIIRQGMSARYGVTFLDLMEQLMRNVVLKEGDVIKTTADSKRIYNNYDAREIDEEKKDARFNYKNDIIIKTHEYRRLQHLQYLYEQIDMLLEKKDVVRVLEIGCGNLINAHHVKEKYHDRVEFQGVDIAEQRIKIGLERFKDLCADDFRVVSITEKTDFEDNQFDIVFSMHCLEQISYETSNAIREMYRICRHRICMIEPVYENGNFVQRLYLITADHTKILLRTIRNLGLKIVRNEVCDLQTNLYNQSSIIIIEKE